MQMIFGSAKAPAGVQDVLSLNGTSPSPILKTQLSTTPREASASWLIGCNDAPINSIISGEVQGAAFDDLALAQYVSDNVSTDWVIPKAFVITYYVRATLDAGSNPTAGSAMDTWLTLVPSGANRSWTWLQVGVGVITGTLKLEIATDSDGNDIVATGYYKARAEVLSLD